MGINTDLNVDPYYDDFSEDKQFNRILFKPAKAVQARELTQLQTILQKQVERFGSNIYKEGTIISGINLTARDDLFFVKVNDQTEFTNPALYNQVKDNLGGTSSFRITGQISGLVAEIIKGQSGFQTQDPDLKTFHIKYLNTTQNGDVDVKQFQSGEPLAITDQFGDEQITVVAATGTTTFPAVGRSFGISCEEGVIFQKGHFIFVDSQFIIVSKYTNSPGTVSVGFTIEENLINSNNDSSLLDNASGFNNENAPGADRLQLVPTLVSYSTATEPTEFFALIRYVDGNPVRIRDRTEFNSINSELARRTYDESGNYVTRGFNVTLEQSGNNAFAVVSPGKAYVYGNEVINISAKRLSINPNTLTQTKINQYTGVSYGQFYTYNAAASSAFEPFAIDGTRYNILNGSTVIGSCSIANVTSGRIYVYAITRLPTKENDVATKIGSVPGVLLTNNGVLYESNASGKIFDAGKSSMNSISSVSVIQRKRLALATPPSDGTLTLSRTSNEQPLTSNIVVISGTNTIIAATAAVVGTNVALSFLGIPAVVYYDAIVTGIQQDALQELDVYVKSVYTEGKATIGLPNAIQLLEVVDDFGNGADITSKFRLVDNQKDHFYDISHITLKAGEVASNSNLRIKVKVLRRTSTVGSGYLTVDSYTEVTSKPLIRTFIGKNDLEYNLLNCYDFRPYANPTVAYTLSTAGAPTATVVATSILSGIQPASDSNISATQSYFMSRIDSVVLDEFGVISLYKGGEAENPSRPEVVGLYALNNIFIPGNQLRIAGNNSIQLQDISNKNYTMRDIAKLDRKVDRLAELVAVSLLESETKDFFIPDGAGNNRFKNGILVDSFKDLSVAELSDPEFKAAIDKTRTVATPAVTQFPIDLKVGSLSGANRFQDVITLADNGTRVNIIDQPYATSFRNCVSNFYSYQGKASILPPFDAGYNVIKNPAVEFEIDFATPLLDLVNNIQELFPLVRETDLGETAGEFAGSARGRVQNFTQSTSVSRLSSTSSQFSTAVGNFITDINLKPYVQSREVKILVTGLRPDTRHYFYFEESPVSAHVHPGSINLTTVGTTTEYNVANVQIAGVKGAAVRTDVEGTLTAVFVIPADTFFVGENTLEIVDVDTYTSIESAKTSFAKATYRAFNFDIGKSDLNFTTRTVDFGIESSIVQRQFTRAAPTDPIAQTFKIRTGQTNGASVLMLSDIDLYFKSKSSSLGVTIEIREVVNGYPSSTVLPFARKHLRANQINVSSNSLLATNFEFKNPIKLNVEREYCFVVIPDANSPHFLIWTSKVGGTDVASGVAITNDWGDGVLFTSTNDSAWKSYQDEDIKFSINRYDFSTSTGHVNLVPNDVEFLTIRNTTNEFLNDELAYVLKNTSYSASVSGTTLQTVTISGTTGFASNDYIFLESGTNKFLSKITNITTSVVQSVTSSIITLESPYNATATTSATAYICVAGRVSYFNIRKPNRIFLKTSSATSSNFINDNVSTAVGNLIIGNTYTITTIGSTSTAQWNAVGVVGTPALGQTFVATSVGATGTTGTAKDNNQIITGYNSGATAIVTSVNNEALSYFQPQIYADNSIRTSTELTLFIGNLVDKIIPSNGNVYLINNVRVINSKSNIVNNALLDSDDFIIRVGMSNNGYKSATPIVDADLSILNVYQYQIASTTSATSTWVTKEITLQDQLDADGMKVFLSAYRPAGTFIDVYARFTYPTNIEVQSDWIELSNKNADMYSNSANTKDYRQFEYDLNEIANPNAYSSFQLKFVMRHGTKSELDAKSVNIVPAINLFPHIYDYRAIALT